MAFESISITGSLQGTASWAVSSSYALTASLLIGTVQSASYNASQWSPTTTITVSATTTAPIKGGVQVDQVRYKGTGLNSYVVDYLYRQTTGGGSGNGDYLFTLPGGLQFNTTIQPIYTGGLAVALWSNTISTTSNMGTDTATLPTAWVIPYNATQFRVIYWENISTIRMFNSNTATSMGFSQSGCHFRFNFEFIAA